ncbi:MAG: DUF2796 domain-containing protein [Pseudomonadota bacterium]
MSRRLPFAAAVAGALVAASAQASDRRSLGAHEHGVGILTIAAEGGRVAMELESPGADIVGFEHPAEGAEDRAAIEDAIAALARPSALFALPEAAGCTVIEASATLVGEDDDHDHDHGAHADHDDHDDDGHADEAHAGDDHDDDHAQGDDTHAGHDEDHDHDHDDHAADEAGGHTEFHAEYVFDCATPGALDAIAFPYFERFPNARELEVRIVTASGARAAEVERDAPSLDIAGGM